MSSEKKGFWKVVASKEFWFGLGCTFGIEFLKSFLESLGKSLIHYSSDKLGPSLLSPPTSKPTSPFSSTPQPPFYNSQPPSPPQQTARELFPNFKY